MKKTIITKTLALSLLIISKTFIAKAQGTIIQNAPSLQTINCLGGSGEDGAWTNFMTATNDGGFITGTHTNSVDGDITGNHGGNDALIIKYSASGAVQWKKTYGGTSDDLAYRVLQTSDGGYIFFGYTYSDDGDVSGNHGAGDLWIVKLDVSGNITWQHCYGGSGDEFTYYGIIQTSDGGYAAVGSSTSSDGDANSNSGGYDALVLKLTSNGTIQWTKSYGGSSDDYGNLVVQNNDGTYTIGVDTYSNDGDVSGNHGGIDTWIARLNANGNIIWKKCFGGSDDEYNASMIKTHDGNILLGEYAGSHDGDVKGNHGVTPNGGDMWLVKINPFGNIIWTRTLGGGNGISPIPFPDDEVALSLIETNAGEFLAAGGNTSSDGDCTSNNGGGDVWVLKLDPSGNILWQKSFGGSDEDAATGIFQRIDGSYFITGWTYSTDFDFNGTGHHGGTEIFIATLVNDNITTPAAQLYNSANGITDDICTNSNSIKLNLRITIPQGYVSLQGVTVKWFKNNNLVFSQCLGNAGYTSINGKTIYKSLIVPKFFGLGDGTYQAKISYNYKKNSFNNYHQKNIWSNDVNIDFNNNCGAKLADENTLNENKKDLQLNLFPNPFSTTTTISFSLTESQNVSLQIFDVSGKLVSALLNEELAEGEHQIEFNAEKIDAGIYFLKMQAVQFIETKKISVIK